MLLNRNSLDFCLIALLVYLFTTFTYHAVSGDSSKSSGSIYYGKYAGYKTSGLPTWAIIVIILIFLLAIICCFCVYYSTDENSNDQGESKYQLSPNVAQFRSVFNGSQRTSTYNIQPDRLVSPVDVVGPMTILIPPEPSAPTDDSPTSIDDLPPSYDETVKKHKRVI